MSSSAYQCAVRLLSRREHGAEELVEKLARKGYESNEITEALSKCQSLGFQCDTRFAQGFTRMRIRQGSGPVKIKQELRALSIDEALIEAALVAEEAQGLAHAQSVWDKKTGHNADLSFEALQKVQRFMMYRGFSVDLINTLVKEYRQQKR